MTEPKMHDDMTDAPTTLRSTDATSPTRAAEPKPGHPARRSSTLRALVACTLMLALPSVGCGDSAEAKEVRENFRQTWESVTDWSQSRWEDFVDASNDRLDELKSEAKELREKAEARGEDVSKDVEQALERAEKKVAELRGKSEDAWSEARDETTRAMQTASKRVQAAWKALKGEKNGSSSDGH